MTLSQLLIRSRQEEIEVTSENCSLKVVLSAVRMHQEGYSLGVAVNKSQYLYSWRYLVDLSLIPAQPKPGLINVLIEIPAGSKNKYEFDKDLNAFALDRVLYSSVQYPYDYGFVPNTLADDGDPLDGMVIIEQPTFPGCVIAARPIGMLEMIDGGDRDEKILCVPDQDPRYSQVKSLKDIAQHRLDEIAEFFRTYKNLEKKVTQILGWKDVESVQPLLEKCIKAG